MKRSPLNRKTELKRSAPTPPVEGEPPPRKPKRKPLAKRPKPPMSDRERELAQIFKQETCYPRGKRAPCARCGTTKGRIDAHHCVPKQNVKWWCEATGQDPLDYVWRPVNGMALCRKCHFNHEAASARVSRDLIREETWVFARSLGLDHLLERLYPGAAPKQGDRYGSR